MSLSPGLATWGVPSWLTAPAPPLHDKSAWPAPLKRLSRPWRISEDSTNLTFFPHLLFYRGIMSWYIVLDIILNSRNKMFNLRFYTWVYRKKYFFSLFAFANRAKHLEKGERHSVTSDNKRGQKNWVCREIKSLWCYTVALTYHPDNMNINLYCGICSSCILYP